jgi:hypothetical protein
LKACCLQVPFSTETLENRDLEAERDTRGRTLEVEWECPVAIDDPLSLFICERKSRAIKGRKRIGEARVEIIGLHTLSYR